MIYCRVILITDESMQTFLNILQLLISLLKNSKEAFYLNQSKKTFFVCELQSPSTELKPWKNTEHFQQITAHSTVASCDTNTYWNDNILLKCSHSSPLPLNRLDFIVHLARALTSF